MSHFYTSTDENLAENYRFCVQRAIDGKIIARCKTEEWAGAITDVLNTIDSIAEQLAVIRTWPD